MTPSTITYDNWRKMKTDMTLREVQIVCRSLELMRGVQEWNLNSIHALEHERVRARHDIDLINRLLGDDRVLVREADPELEALLDEEEEIARQKKQNHEGVWGWT